MKHKKHKYIGIDGGGTKTNFCLAEEADGSFNILSEYQTTGCYYPNIGKNGIIEVIRKGVGICLKNAGINKISEIKKIQACCGLPAYGELESLMTDVPEIQSEMSVSIIFCNDAEICHAGALDSNPGITVIAGTGSIAFGYDGMGKKARSGGFGSEMNCDEGSAHYIGLKLIQKFTKQADFREERTLLYDKVKKALELKTGMDIYEFMVEKIKMNREYIAKMAVLAYNTACLGDTVCKGIFSEAAYELYLMAAAVKKQLSLEDFFENSPVQVSYAGGVFRAGEYILPELGNLLKKDGMILIEPKYPPVIGACILAKNYMKLNG
jgi:N-acetylglucosamine kinase-like BadF-type ATPase